MSKEWAKCLLQRIGLKKLQGFARKGSSQKAPRSKRWNFSNLNNFMVNLTTKQVETLFGELEYIEARLKALDTPPRNAR